jgi:hypothetical protein
MFVRKSIGEGSFPLSVDRNSPATNKRKFGSNAIGAGFFVAVDVS